MTVESEERCDALHLAVDRRARGTLADEVRGWTRREDCIRATERQIRKMQGMAFAEGVLWKRKGAGGPLGKLTCMWEDGIYLGVKATTAEFIVVNLVGVWLTRNVRRKPAMER